MIFYPSKIHQYIPFAIVWKILLTTSAAQVADTTRVRDSVKYKLIVASTGSWNQSANVNTYLTNNAIRFSASHQLFSMNFAGSYVYGLSNQLMTNNDVMVSLDGNLYQRNSKFFYWILTNYTSSYSLKIKDLFQSGAGIAYDFVKTKENRFTLSDGVLYEKDNLFLDTAYNIYSTFRNSFRLSFKWTVVNKLVFEGTSFLQNSFTNGDDYIIRSNFALLFNLNKWLSLTSTFVFNRFNRTGQQNLLLTYGLRVEKDF